MKLIDIRSNFLKPQINKKKSSKMPIETINFFDCLEGAYQGKYRLPVFQREWKWQRKKVIALFDSLRSDYPIGTILTAKAEALSSSELFQFGESDRKKLKSAEYLILDGQQRITSGLQLFYGDAESQLTHYFIDIEKIKELLSNWQKNKPTPDTTQEEMDKFGKTLEPDDGYLTARAKSKNPHSLFIDKGKIFTPLLAKWNTTQWANEREKYLSKFPRDRSLIDWIYNFFQAGNLNPQIPNIIIPETDHRLLSRIFSTLNNTGIKLTSYELAVSEMFGQGINLKKEIEEQQSKLKYYPNMDPTNEIVLQTAILFDGGDPKKANLSKNLNKTNWQKHKNEAFRCLEEVGEWLDKNMGFALENSKNFVPYDSLFLPLAFLWKHSNPTTISKASKQGKAIKIVKKYVVSACLHTRFTEGAFTKQILDAKNLVSAIENLDERKLDESLFVPYSGLHSASPKGGAIGKIVLCLLNSSDLRDPLSEEKLNLNKDKIQLHHSWPSDYVSGLPNNNDGDKGNLVANIMIVSQETNSEFSNLDPSQQLEKVDNTLGSKAQKILNAQLFDPAAIEVMRKNKKTYGDFENFINLRVASIAQMISAEFGLEYLGLKNAEDQKLDLDEDY